MYQAVTFLLEKTRSPEDFADTILGPLAAFFTAEVDTLDAVAEPRGLQTGRPGHVRCASRLGSF